MQKIEESEHAVLSAPDSEANRLSLAALYLQVGQESRAIAVLYDYVEKNPRAVKSLQLIAVAHLRQEEYNGAKQYAAQALSVHPSDPTSMRVLAMAELGLQETDDAERLLRESLKLEPDSVDSNFQLGLLDTKKREKLDEAVRLLENARRLKPDLAAIHTVLGSAFLASGKPEAAIKSLETAVALAPDSAESYYILADAYRQLHQADRAQASLAEFNTRTKAAADRKSREMRCHGFYERGIQLLSNTDDLDGAFMQFQNAVNELPNFDPGYYRLAQVYYLKGDLPRALSFIRRALSLNALEPEYYYVEARCLETTDKTSALIAIRKAVALRPDVADFQDLLQTLEQKDK